MEPITIIEPPPSPRHPSLSRGGGNEDIATGCTTLNVKRNSLDLLKATDAIRKPNVWAKRKSREISAADLNDLSSLRRRQRIKTSVLREQRANEKFRSELKELRENLTTISSRIELMSIVVSERKHRSKFHKWRIKLNGRIAGRTPGLEHFFIHLSLTLLAMVLSLHMDCEDTVQSLNSYRMALQVTRSRRLCTIRRLVLAILTFFAASPLLVIFFMRDPGESLDLGKSIRNFGNNAMAGGDRGAAGPPADQLGNQGNDQHGGDDQQPHEQGSIVHRDIPKPVLKLGKVGNYEPSIPRKGPYGPGEGGKKVGRDPAKEEDYAKSYKEYGFNMINSDTVSLDRTVPDLRDSECKYWQYPAQLPSSSVVIVFHNEGWSTLMRTVHSIINETPPNLLLEIVMVDDFSNKEHLKAKLDDYIKIPFFNNKVRLFRNTKREGLIRSRIIGAEHARAQILIFLDAHCECNPNWLPPLVAEIAVDRTTVVCPTVDSIDADTYEYRPQGDGLCRGIFNWDFWYKRVPVDESRERLGLKHRSESYASPVMAGGLFGLDRSYFFELGAYDPGLEIWGGENMEISFKAWMCGGSLKFVPCSRVGHIYRHGVPYTYPDSGVKGVSVVHMNYMRVAEVWMDEYKEYFYTLRPELRGKPFGDISEQVAFRKQNCPKSFKWFMEEVAPDSMEHWPPPPPNQGYGEIKAVDSDLCVDTMGITKGDIGMYYCHGMGGNQRFRVDGNGRFLSHDNCMYPNGDKVSIIDCKAMWSKVKWEYSEAKKQISIPTRNMCLDHEKATKELKLSECNIHKASQHFLINPPTD